MRKLTKKLMLLLMVLFTVSMSMAQNTPQWSESPATQNLLNQQMVIDRLAADQMIDMDVNVKVTSIPSEDMFDLQFDWPVGVGGGEAGIETDGSYIYTTKWNGSDFYRYAMDGTYIESFTCGSAASIRDLAYDGTYFYGGAASPTVYEMDFDAQTTISSFTAPTDCRAIAYNEDDDAFYAIEDVCTHDGGMLTGGCIEGDQIVCPRHGARFSIRTGDALTAPAYEPTAIFSTRIENGIVQVRDDRWD
jgi:3-phenylpropionate/trans-cinnamate dioxygenase ferredoxin subunit